MKLRTMSLGGKAAKLAENTDRVQRLHQIVAQQEVVDEFQIQRVPLDEVDPDPDQPREMGLTWEVLQAPETIEDENLKGRVERIHALAESLRDIDQQIPIEVYRANGRFRLVAGERRYWAARLAGKSSLYAKLLPDKPTRLRLKQYIENAAREDLLVREKLVAFKSIIDESEINGRPIDSAKALQSVSALSTATAWRWWTVLNGPGDILQSVATGALASLEQAAELAKVEDNATRDAMLKETLRTGRIPAVEPSRGKRKKVAAARPTPFRLGATRNAKVIEYVIDRLAPKGLELKVNYNNPESVTKALKAIIGALEKRFKT